MRRMSIVWAFGAIAFVLAAGVAAQSYPSKPIRLIVPFATGGPTDALARLYGDALGAKLGQSFVVEAKPGAAGNIGSDFVAKAPPDGYTLLLGSLGTHGINANLYSSIPFDTARDFTPIGLIAQTAHVLVVHPSLGVKNLAELIAYAKANPGKISYASAGTGSTPHLAVELLEARAGIQMVHVPYKGGGQAITDLLSGRVQLMMPTVLLPLQYIKNGSLIPIAVSTRERDPVLPAVPTMAEAGLSGYEMSGWFGILGPANVPHGVVTRLNEAIVQVAATDELRQKLLAVGMVPVTSTPEALGALINAELAKWHGIVKAAGVKVE